MFVNEMMCQVAKIRAWLPDRSRKQHHRWEHKAPFRHKVPFQHKAHTIQHRVPLHQLPRLVFHLHLCQQV